MKRTIFALLVVLSSAMMACTDDDEYAVNIMPPSLEEQIEKEYIHEQRALWELVSTTEYGIYYRHYYDLWKEGNVLLVNKETNTASIMTISEADAIFESYVNGVQPQSYQTPKYSPYNILDIWRPAITLDFLDYFDNYGILPEKKYVGIISRELVPLTDIESQTYFALTLDDIYIYFSGSTGIRNPTKMYWLGDDTKGVPIPMFSEVLFYPDLSGVSVYKINIIQPK